MVSIDTKQPPVNHDPIINGFTLDSIEVGQTLVHSIIATDSDHNPLRFSLSLKPDGMAVDPTTGVLVWTPTAEQLGEHAAIVRVQDGRGGIDIQYLELSVQPLNQEPVFVSILDNETPQVDRPFQYQSQAMDADGDVLTYQLNSHLSGLAIDAITGVLSWTPTKAQVGNHEITIVVDDGKGGQDLQILNLSVIESQPNNAPQITSNPPIQTQVNHLYLYQVLAEDLDGDPLTYTLSHAPDGMTIDENGLITWETAVTDLGEHLVEIRVEDGQNGIATQSFSLNIRHQVINQAPSITSSPLLQTHIERVYQYQAQASDPDGDYLFWSLEQGSQGMVLNPETGVLSWRPTAQQVGSHHDNSSVLIDPSRSRYDSNL